MESPMRIRQVKLLDLEEIVRIEQANFLGEEATSPEKLKEQIEKIPNTFLIADLNGEIAGYIIVSAVSSHHQSADCLVKGMRNLDKSNFIFLQRLSINPDFKGQGVGTLLLAAMKEVVVDLQNQGIYLACKDHLLSYFVMNGFSDSGIFETTYGDGAHIEMIWENPYFKE